MDFVIRLPVLTNWKDKSYNSILVIIAWLIKIVYYEPIKITINILKLAEVIFNIVVWHHDLFNSIVFDKN